MCGRGGGRVRVYSSPFPGGSLVGMRWLWVPGVGWSLGGMGKGGW